MFIALVPPSVVMNADGANKLASWYKKPPAASKPEPEEPEPATVKSLSLSYVSYSIALASDDAEPNLFAITRCPSFL
jgi:hypothetical protein